MHHKNQLDPNKSDKCLYKNHKQMDLVSSTSNSMKQSELPHLELPPPLGFHPLELVGCFFATTSSPHLWGPSAGSNYNHVARPLFSKGQRVCMTHGSCQTIPSHDLGPQWPARSKCGCFGSSTCLQTTPSATHHPPAGREQDLFTIERMVSHSKLNIYLRYPEVVS